jgi:dTDP-4-dehydrorhamnose 3,5-epimerase
MQVTRLDIDGLLVFEPRVFEDERGAFFESFNLAHKPHPTPHHQHNHHHNQSISRRNVLRGLHNQAEPHAQGKLDRVAKGVVWDVAVDIRPDSSSFGRWAAVELSAANRRQLWIPPGFAHGFLSLEDDTHFLYKVTDYWHGASERAIRWDDPAIGVEWPLHGAPVLSAKDAAAPLLDQTSIS